MHDQPKYIPLRESTFFADARVGAAARRRAPSRAASCTTTTLLYTGKVERRATPTVFPFPVDARGDGARPASASTSTARRATAGPASGDGMVVRRGYRRPPSFHDDRLRNAPVGHFFDVMTNGFGAMPDYAAQIPAERSLGDRRLHPRAAAERARDARRRAAGRSRELDAADGQ